MQLDESPPGSPDGEGTSTVGIGLGSREELLFRKIFVLQHG
jgi:hypothetical protein